MDLKQILETYKHILISENTDIISKDNYLEYKSAVTGNLKRIYYIDKQLELLEVNKNIK